MSQANSDNTTARRPPLLTKGIGYGRRCRSCAVAVPKAVARRRRQRACKT